MDGIEPLSTKISNVYLVKYRDHAILIDSGHKFERTLIVSEIRRILGQGWEKMIAAVLLTHAHPDHDGNVHYFAKKTGCKIIGTPEEAVYAANLKRVDFSKFKFLGNLTGLLFKLLTLISSPQKIHIDGAILPHQTMWGLVAIPVPGHTPGSVLYYHRESKTLFSGDSLLTAKPPWILEEKLSLPERAFCSDYEKAIESLRVFLDIDFNHLCPGHGPILFKYAYREVSHFLQQQVPTLFHGSHSVK